MERKNDYLFCMENLYRNLASFMTGLQISQAMFSAVSER